VQPLRRSAEMQLLADGHEVTEMPQLDRGPWSGPPGLTAGRAGMDGPRLQDEMSGRCPAAAALPACNRAAPLSSERVEPSNIRGGGHKIGAISICGRVPG
jgi:hypothetical protein